MNKKNKEKYNTENRFSNKGRFDSMELILNLIKS